MDGNVTQNNLKTYLTGGAVLVALLLIFGGLASIRANADYICTRVIEDSGSCTNGAWGGWDAVNSSTDPDTGDETIEEARVYTGTRVIRHTISYLNRRTSCDAGYDQRQYADTKGESGFHGGKIVTESQVCQIQESRTRVVDGDTGEETIDGAVVTTALNNGSAGNATSQEETTINSLDEINAFRRANRDLGFSVQPSIVASGDTTTVKWTTVEMDVCTVTADNNGDRWGATSLEGADSSSTAGEETSSPITQVTTYTLSCIDFEGNPMEEQATVHLVPQWEEF